jgi:lysyl-tRNA synthetase class 1
VLKARYADLAWDLSRAVANTNPDPAVARTAIDAYLASLDRDLLADIHDRFGATLRALDLALTLCDSPRVARARAALLAVHAQAMGENKGLWWIAFDRLIADKRCELRDAERDGLVADLEAIVAQSTTFSDPKLFNPHSTKDAAERLIKHYTKLGSIDHVKRLHLAIATSFEHFASLGNAMVASGALQTAVNAYRSAGRADDSRRVRVLMEEKIARSREELKPMAFERTITREDMEQFLAQVVTKDAGTTLALIASGFVDRRIAVEKAVSELMAQAPLMATITQTIMADRHVAATVGSVTQDPFGRLIQNASQRMGLNDVWLVNALSRAIEVHNLTPQHLASWAARTNLYDDLTLLIEGINAWFEQDFVKAVHVLVPQVEAGLRSIVGKLGRPVTKAHPKIAGVGVAVNMGDILYSTDITEALGPDITLYFLTLYADPRGYNLRNEIAHGLLRADRMHLGLASRVLHTLLVLGVWSELAEGRKRFAPGAETGISL